MNRIVRFATFPIIVLIITILLSACTTATETNPSVPPTREKDVFPKAGHWEGEGKEPVEADVKFDLSSDRVLNNFTMSTTLFGLTKCKIELRDIQMNVKDPDGKFVISYFQEYDDVSAQLGDAVMSLSGIPKGEPYEVFRVEGTATATTLTGTYSIKVCGNHFRFEPAVGPWNAEWKTD